MVLIQYLIGKGTMDDSIIASIHRKQTTLKSTVGEDHAEIDSEKYRYPDDRRIKRRSVGRGRTWQRSFSIERGDVEKSKDQDELLGMAELRYGITYPIPGHRFSARYTISTSAGSLRHPKMNIMPSFSALVAGVRPES